MQNINYPSNSHKSREERKENKKVDKIVSGKVVKRKKSLTKRFTETFIGEDASNVGSYIIHDVLVPAFKGTLSDMVQGGIEVLLFGERKGSRGGRERPRSYVSYDRYHSDNRRDDRRDISQRNRARHNFDEVVLDSRGEAEEVISHLVDLIDDYGQATVADLYELVGIKHNYTERDYGWTNLSSAGVSRTRDGYLLNLPRPVVLD